MRKLDDLMLNHLADRCFTPKRLQTLLEHARRFLRERASGDRAQLAKLQAELRRTEERLNRLYDTLESGAVPLDEVFQRRAQQAKSAREAVLIEMAGLRRRQSLPEAFSKVIREKLLDRSSGFVKDYLCAVVDEVCVFEQSATITGGYTRLLSAVGGKKEGTDQLPSFMRDWRGRKDWNLSLIVLLC